MYNKSTPNKIGNANIKYRLFSTTRKRLKATNNVTMQYRLAILIPFCKMMRIILLRKMFLL